MKWLLDRLAGFVQAAVLVIACLGLLHCVGCAAPPPPFEPGICIPPEVLAQCEEEGGCVLFSRARFEQIVARACKGST